MPLYRYRAQTEEGRQVSGRLQANDEQDLHDKLRSQQIMLTDSKIVSERRYFRPLKTKQLAEFSRQVGTLLKAGVSLVRALKIITEDEAITPAERNVYNQVLQFVLQGIPLSDALEKMNGVFPPLIVNMYRAAETSGTLDQTALRMADQYGKEDKLQKKVKNSMLYPKILGVMIIGVVAIIMGFVMPQFKDLFDAMPSLPPATQILFAISNFVQEKWYVLIIGTILLVIAVRFIFKIPKVRYGWDWLKVHIFKFGKMNKVIYTAHFARTLSSLYSSGIPIVTSLEIARKTVGNTYIDKQFDDVISKVKAGATLSDSLDGVDGFIKKLTSAMHVGEETGALDSMLNSTADDLDYEAEMATTRMVTYLEPLMIIIMAVIVGFIMIAVITPIYQSYSSIGAGS
jgi:type IV pilus assembly protein PilC